MGFHIDFTTATPVAHFFDTPATYYRNSSTLSRFIPFFNLLLFCCWNTANKKQNKKKLKTEPMR